MAIKRIRHKIPTPADLKAKGFREVGSHDVGPARIVRFEKPVDKAQNLEHHTLVFDKEGNVQVHVVHDNKGEIHAMSPRGSGNAEFHFEGKRHRINPGKAVRVELPNDAIKRHTIGFNAQMGPKYEDRDPHTIGGVRFGFDTLDKEGNGVRGAGEAYENLKNAWHPGASGA